MGKDYVIGVDIGGTNFRIGMVTEDGELYNFVIENSSILEVNEESIENLINYIKDYMTKNLEGYLLAISIGFPSTVSKDKKVVYSTPNMKGFSNIDVVTPLERAFNIPVFIDKDVNYLLQCEIVRRKLFNPGIVIGIYIGTGYGNSVYLNDNFLVGKNGVASELGHIPVANRNDICGCGNKGCIECYASGKRLKELKDAYFPDTDISKIFVLHKEEPIILDFIDLLTIPIATEINIFDPDLVIIGGGVVQMEGFPKEYFESCIYNHTRKPYPAQNLNISYTLPDQKAGILGSAYYAYSKLKR